MDYESRKEALQSACAQIGQVFEVANPRQSLLVSCAARWSDLRLLLRGACQEQATVGGKDLLPVTRPLVLHGGRKNAVLDFGTNMYFIS
jgi:hypothetical protein